MTNLLDFTECICLGVTRCNSEAMLNAYYLRWSGEINAGANKERIIEAFRVRKEELISKNTPRKGRNNAKDKA